MCDEGSEKGDKVKSEASGGKEGLAWGKKSLSFPLPVQHECIPQAILGMDVLCQAKSGMGKTAVFVLATLQQLEPVTGQVCWGALGGGVQSWSPPAVHGE